MNRPLFSIITVVYNGAGKLQATLDSVFRQTSGDWELIVIDGASTDATIDIIKKNEQRITFWSSEPDKGLYDAMNKGVRAAKGLYLYFLNVGDNLADERVLEEVTKLTASEPGLVYGIARTKNNPLGFEYNFGKEISIKDFYFHVAPICHQASFIHRSSFAAVGAYDISYRLFADMDHFIRLFSSDKVSRIFTERLIAEYEVEGLSFNNRYTSLKENLRSAKAHFPWYITLLKYLNYPFLWLKVSVIRLLKDSWFYTTYKRLRHRAPML